MYSYVLASLIGIREFGTQSVESCFALVICGSATHKKQHALYMLTVHVVDAFLHGLLNQFQHTAHVGAKFSMHP